MRGYLFALTNVFNVFKQILMTFILVKQKLRFICYLIEILFLKF